jgi:hypothetical protein
MKKEIIKFIQGESCSSTNDFKFSNFLIFEIFYIAIWHSILVTFKCFIHINAQAICDYFQYTYIYTFLTSPSTINH